MWKWNSAPRHHLCPEDGEWFYSRTSQWVCTSGQACCCPGVRDGRVSATVVHDRVERSKRQGDMNMGVVGICVLIKTYYDVINSLFCFGVFSQCSRSCGKGLQMREVRCLTPDKKHSLDCDSNTKPEQEQICNTIPCSPQVAGLCVSVCWCDSYVSWLFSQPASLFFLFYHRWELPGQTPQLCDGGAGQAVRLPLLQDCLLCLVYPECTAFKEALTWWAQTAPVCQSDVRRVVYPSDDKSVEMDSPE